MKKIKWNRKLSILVLIMFVTVSFASFNTNLFIDGKAYVRVDKDIRITNIRLLESEYNGYENTSSEYTNRTISTDVSLPRQASSVTYEVTVSNVSDKRYKITDIIEESYDNRNVKYELIDASIGNIVEPHTEKTFKVKFTNNVTVVEEDDVYQTLTYTFDYTGGEQEFIVPYDGTYTLEVWGAQGGNNGGLGGYSIGKIQLKKGKSLFINVGGAGIKGCDQTLGNDVFVNGGYNGGGSTYTWKDNKCAGSGGGATHISYKKGLLSSLENRIESILIVAGGGGGQGISGYGTAGSGGGYIGNSGTATDSWYGTGGTQEQGGKDKNSSAALVHSGFGQGTSLRYGNGSGGGGGYYGGGAGYGAGGFSGGGSGYIGNTLLYDKAMYCYKCAESSEDNTKTITTNDNSTTPETNKAKKGNGYAKITLTRKIEDGSEYDFDYTGGEQTFTVPYSGLYKLETWGAQGGSDRSGTSGGYGGYSTGQIELIKNTNLYLYNGGKGNDAGAANTTSLGGYNGGGNASSKSAADTSNWGAGGGASHIAFEQGLLSTYSDTSKLSNLLIVAGAGGGAGGYGNNSNNGGSGGGYIGSSGMGEGFGTGGTQVSGGIGDTKEKPTDDGKIGLGGNFDKTEWGAGGGSGFYGGGVGYRHGGSAGGGSGYIANENLKNKIMYCYNCEESNDINTKTVSTQSHSKMPNQNIAKEGNGFSRITLLKRTINQTNLTLDFTFEEYLNGNEYTFGYTGEPQEFTAPKTGYYQIELWGAEGGSFKGINSYGAYTYGKIKLNKNEKLYVYVGGKGKSFNYGDQTYLTNGGGSTDIRLITGDFNNIESLKSRIMVAAGGGSSGGLNSWDGGTPAGGQAGGLIGYQGYEFLSNNTTEVQGGLGATQTSGEVFGQIIKLPDRSCPGGGNGYFAGFRNTFSGSGVASSGGGSSYISGHNGCVAIKEETTLDNIIFRDDSNGNECIDGTTDVTCSKHYSNYVFDDTRMVDGKGYEWTTEVGTEVVGMPTHDGTTTMIGNAGDGFAKITCLEEITDYTFDYTGEPQEFIAPYKGLYKVELWGASGGSGSADGQNYVYPGGNGAYTSGKINLSKNQKLYLYVGREGAKHAWDSEELSPSSFNGGGAGGFDAATNNTSDGGGSGGGATDIRLTKGNWNNFDSLKSRIMVSAGGGGGAWKSSDIKRGQNGSGLYVKGFGIQSSYYAKVVSDGTQFSGYKFGIGKDGESSSSGSSIAGDGGGYWTGVYDSSTKTGIGGTSYISGHQGCVSIAGSSTETNISFVNDSNGVMCNSSESTGYNESGYNADVSCSKHYSEMEFFDTVMIDGAGYQWTSNGSGDQIVKIPSHDGRTEMIGNTGNGYAKITLLEKIDTYNINYDLDGGTLNKKKNTYSNFDDTFTLGTPTKDGHTFLGWIGGKNLLNPDLYMDNKYQDYNVNTNAWGIVNNTNYWVTGLQKVKPNTYYTTNFAPYGAFYDENGVVIKGPVVRTTWLPEYQDTQINTDNPVTFKTPSNAYYVNLIFSKGHKSFNRSATIQMEEGTKSSDYEPFNNTPNKVITILKGSQTNYSYKAVWRDDSVLCRKATTLHSTTCSWAYEDNKACRGAGYSIGDNITYGSLVDGTLKSGDAFDCDVNGDGKYDGNLERFYYMGNLDSNSEYAVLIYSNLIKGGIKATTYSHIKWGTSNANNLGPTTAINDLPTTSQWSNVSLYNNNRQIYSENKIMTTSAGNNVIFDYSGRSARLPTYDEIKIACDNNISKLHQYCEYILEGTSYDLGVGTENYGFWLENPTATSSENVFEIDSHWRSFSSAYTVDSTHFMVKPVIEVPKSKLRY